MQTEDQSQVNSSKDHQAMDFFLCAPLGKFKNAIAALADTDFNPTQDAVIQVGEGGCEITVLKFEGSTRNEIFGHLRLRASALDNFECQNPLRRQFSCKDIVGFLEEAEEFGATVVSVFAVSGTLNLEWGRNADELKAYMPLEIPLQPM